MRSGGQRLRSGIVNFLLERGGFPFPVSFLERLRDFANYALGSGSASLTLDQSGEIRLLAQLQRAFADRTHVTVLDVGAHTGSYTEAVHGVFGSRAQIHCFEPNPVTFETLRANVPYAQAHPYGLGAEPARVPLFADEPRSPRSSLHPQTFEVAEISATEHHEVEIKTLDAVARDHGITRVDMLKVDVEGHELAVLHGASRLLHSGMIDVIQFEFGERNLTSRTYLRDFVELLGADYCFFRLTRRGLSPLDYRPASEVFLLETNYVAVRGTVNALVYPE